MQFGIVSLDVENMRIEESTIDYKYIYFLFANDEGKGVVKIVQKAIPNGPTKVIKNFKVENIKSFLFRVNVDWKAMEESYVCSPRFEYFRGKYNVTYIGEIKITSCSHDLGIISCSGRVRFRNES
jgi:hypothetical protein